MQIEYPLVHTIEINEHVDNYSSTSIQSFVFIAQPPSRDELSDLDPIGMLKQMSSMPIDTPTPNVYVVHTNLNVSIISKYNQLANINLSWN